MGFSTVLLKYLIRGESNKTAKKVIQRKRKLDKTAIVSLENSTSFLSFLYSKKANTAPNTTQKIKYQSGYELTTFT